MRNMEESHEVSKSGLLKELDEVGEQYIKDVLTLNDDYQKKLKIAYDQHD